MHDMLRGRLGSQHGAALALVLELCTLAACGGGSSAGGAPRDSQRAAAAASAAMTSDACTAIGDFYWEIGDAGGVRASGSVGERYTPTSPLPIASSAKLVWAAYVTQRLGGVLTSEQIASLEMTSGYPSFDPLRCTAQMTVDTCFVAGGGMFDASTVGSFHYSGAHDQHLAIELGLGTLDPAGVTAEVRAELGDDLEFSYLNAQPAGGLISSAAQYAIFLRKILAGGLVLRELLGVDPVCGATGVPSSATSCPGSWHYGYNHWIEDDESGDGSFSSPGAFGFYPWISADETIYGILARSSTAPGATDASIRCGQAIRGAWRMPAASPRAADAGDARREHDRSTQTVAEARKLIQDQRAFPTEALSVPPK